MWFCQCWWDGYVRGEAVNKAYRFNQKCICKKIDLWTLKPKRLKWSEQMSQDDKGPATFFEVAWLGWQNNLPCGPSTFPYCWVRGIYPICMVPFICPLTIVCTTITFQIKPKTSQCVKPEKLRSDHLAAIVWFKPQQHPRHDTLQTTVTCSSD